MNIPKNGSTISTITAFFILLVMPLFFAATESAALDNPHIPNNTVNCSTCHIAAPPASWWTDQGQAGGLCGQCHNAAAVLGSDVTTHVSTKYGNVILQCTDCHNPHYQRQSRVFRNQTPGPYLATGTIESINALRTQITKPNTTPAWGTDDWKNMFIIPDIRYPVYLYRISTNDAHTITINTGSDGSDAFNSIIQPGATTTFAIVYGKLVKESVWGKVVRFFRKSGANSFADGDATIDGICQVCHTRTIAFNSTGTLEDPTNLHPKNVTGTDCKACHTHTNNFKAACNACHGYPPIDATAGGPSGLADNNGATAGGTTGSTTPGAHARHVTTEGIACASCHYGSVGSGATHNNGDLNVTLGFYFFSGAAQGGSYNGQTTVNYNATATTPATTTSKLGGLTCGTVYCHSTVQGLGGTGAPTYKTPSWTNTAPNNVICGSCHNDNTETAGAAHTGVIMSSGTHTKHVASSGYSMPCATCHSGAGSGTSVHVNNAINVAIDASYGGTYGGDTGNTGNHAPGQGYGTCSTNYCHSTGTASPTYKAPVWGGAVVCGDCHGADATTPPSSSSHAKHVGSSSVYKFNCKKCHSVTVDSTAADSTTKPGIADKTVHVMNKTRDVNLNTSDPLVGSLATNSGTNCANIYCHSTGKAADVPATQLPAAYSGTHYSAVTWGATTITCASCHGKTATVAGMPDYTSVGTGQTTSNSHSKHVNQASDCGICHNDTTTTGTSIIGTLHVNKTAEVTIANAYDNNNIIKTDNYNATVGQKTCSNVYCHDPAKTGTIVTPGWGGTLPDTVQCDSCHGGNSSSAATPGVGPMVTGKHGAHVNNADAALGSFACGRCHSGTATTGNDRVITGTKHTNLIKDVEYDSLNTGAMANTCASLYCHSDGKGSYTNYTLATDWYGATTLDCKGCHGKTSTFGQPDYANGGAGAINANSHNPHVGSAADCANCHTDTTTTGTAIKAASTLHINQTRNVNFAASFDQNAGTNSDNYNTLNKNCSSISCHGAGTPQWGGASLTCSACHVGTGDVNDYTWGNYGGTAARIDSTEWGYSGHGKVAGIYDVTLNPAANFLAAAGAGDPCLYCHDGTGVAHGDATNVFRLRNFADATFGKNGACMKCHGTGQAGVDPDGAGLVYANKTATKKVDKYHYGTQHSAAFNGGQFCWDCHDPHGDSTSALAGPIAMVHLNPAQASNATTGAPTTVTANAVTFTARSAPSDYGSNVATKICNVCHTYKAADPNKMVHYYNTTPFTDSHNSGTVCTQCHKHSADTTYNGDAFKGGGCNGCHDYDSRVAISWGTGFTPQAVEGFGAHQKHIDHIKARFTVTLNPNTDSFGTGAAAQVCGTCHTNTGTNHTTGGGTRLINFGDATYKEGGSTGFSFLFDPAAPTTNPPIYNGVSGTSSSVNLKSCSNISCHFQTTPAWSAY